MADRLCPNCGHFALKFVPALNPKDDAFVCANCGHRIPASEINGVELTPDTIQRFPNPGLDQTPQDTLSTFVGKKRQ